MRTANLKILSLGDGWQDRLEVPCLVDGLSVSYKNNGDECGISAGIGGVKMYRRGSVRLEMSFVLGQNTVCLVGDSAAGAGELPCFTEVLEIKEGKKGFNLKLGYTLGGQRVNLSATIIYGL